LPKQMSAVIEEKSTKNYQSPEKTRQKEY